MQPDVTSLRAAWGNRQGSVAIEFAMLIPLFLLLIIGLIELGFINWTSISMARAAEVGNKYLVDTRQNMQTPVYATMRNAICAEIRSSGLSCDNLRVAVYAYDNPTTSPVTLPKPLVDVEPSFTAQNYILAVGYNWTFGLISTPLLVPSVGGVRQLRKVTYVATAERPIE